MKNFLILWISLMSATNLFAAEIEVEDPRPPRSILWSALNYDTVHAIYADAAERSGNPMKGLHATKELITNCDTFPVPVDFTGFDPYLMAA